MTSDRSKTVNGVLAKMWKPTARNNSLRLDIDLHERGVSRDNFEAGCLLRHARTQGLPRPPFSADILCMFKARYR